jgi:hypothetical protein
MNTVLAQDSFLADGSSTKLLALHQQVTGKKNVLLAAQAEKMPSKKLGKKDKGHMLALGGRSDKH